MTYFIDFVCLVVWLVPLTSGQVEPSLKFKTHHGPFRFIIHVTSWAGLELQRAGPGRVNKIWAVQLSKSDAINMLHSRNHKKLKIDNLQTATIFDFTIKIFKFFDRIH